VPVIGMSCLLLLFLFKPSEQYSQYEWLFKPLYIINISMFISVLSFIGVCIFFIYCILKINKFKKINKNVLIMIFLFMISSIVMQSINLIYGQNIDITIIKLCIDLVILGTIGFYVNYICDSKLNYKLFIIPIFIASSLFIAINSTLLIFDTSSVYSLVSGRMYGTLDHPNFFGVTVGLISLTSTYFFLIHFKSNGVIANSFCIFIIIMSVVMVVFSGSRTSLLMLVSGYLYYFIGSKINKKNKILFVLFVLFLYAIYEMIYLSTLSSADIRILSTENTRVLAWDYLIRIIIENPAFGIGLNNLHFSESSYLRPLAAYGIFGSLLYFSLVLFSFFISFVFHKNNYNLNFNYSGIIICLLIGGVTEGYLIEAVSFPSLVFKYTIIYSVVCRNIFIKDNKI
jgi:hypothetical protein